MIRRRLQAEPALSDRALAKEFKVSHPTIAALRAELAGVAKTSKAKTAPAPIIAEPLADDPKSILQRIARDETAPATARVAAAKALLAMERPTAEQIAAEKVDKVTARALQLIDGGRR
jgi:hypothetical protein